MVLQRLEAAVADASLSDASRDTGRELLSRLATGVRVVITGPQGVGKSTLCDVLAGGSGFSEPLPATRVFQHEDTGATGSQVILRPTGFLKSMQLTDFHGNSEPAAQSAALDEADIVIWCTATFSQAERDVWAPVPDHLKDHSFLVLPRADILARDGLLAGRVAALRDVAREEFHNFFPVAPLSIAKRIRRGDPVSDGQLSASGVSALSEAIRNLASSGRQADLDSAYLFLGRCGHEEISVPAGTQSQTAGGPSGKTAVRDVITLAARNIADLHSGVAMQNFDALRDLFSELSEELSDLAADAKPEDADARAWWDELSTASDKLMLAGLEKGPGAAADAATIVLQLSRDVQSGAFA